LDGDRTPDVREYNADTDPTDTNSVLRILRVDRSAGGVSLQWQGGHSATQEVQRRASSELAEESWAAIFTNLPPTTVTNTFMDVGDTNRSSLYRIEAWR
jgi:hypothetical protein